MAGDAAAFTVRDATPADESWIRERVIAAWGLPVVSISGLHDPTTLPALVAEDATGRVGHASYRMEGGDCEVVTLEATRRRHGIGTALLDGVRARAGSRRVWLITTNENLGGLAFYQQVGMDLVALHRDFADTVARHKSLPPPPPGAIAFRHALELAFSRPRRVE